MTSYLSLIGALSLSLSPCALLQCQIQAERQRIQTGFDQLRRILDEEEQRELKRLGEEEQLILDSLVEAEAELAQQSQLVQELISGLELRCQWPATELLQVGMSTSQGRPQRRCPSPSWSCALSVNGSHGREDYCLFSSLKGNHSSFLSLSKMLA